MITIKYGDKTIVSNIITLSDICHDLLTMHDIAETGTIAGYINDLNYSANSLLAENTPAKQAIERSIDLFIDYLNLGYDMDIELPPSYIEVLVADK